MCILRKTSIISAVLLCTILFATTLPAQNVQFKHVEIDGLKIFTKDELITGCGLNRFPLNASAFKEAAKRINNYYYTRGFNLAITYRIEETPEKLVLFVDEGRLGQIVIKGVDDITLVRLKYDFALSDKIYNRFNLDSEILRMKKRYGFKEIQANLVEAKDYSQQFLQIDGSFQLPLFGEQRIPFFEQFGYRYNLVIEPSLYSKNEAARSGSRLEYGLRFYYPGIIPKVRYKYPSFIVQDDKLTIDSSAGISKSITSPLSAPTLAFIQSAGDYDFVPMFDSFFTPRISANVYYSASQRSDIGLRSYKYIQTSDTLSPGITILKNLKIFAGTGLEKIFFFDEKIDLLEESKSTEKRNQHTWYTFSLKFELEHYFGFLHPSLVRGAQASYTYYKDDISFHKIDFSLYRDFTAYKLDIFSLGLRAVRLIGQVPFYYEHPVSDEDFFGFTGSNYFTDSSVKCRMMYMSSIYRDYIFAGPYIHGAAFNPLHNNLKGRQYGVAYGVSAKYLFLDQFEAKVSAGKDYLFSTKKVGCNLSLGIEKKF